MIVDISKDNNCLKSSNVIEDNGGADSIGSRLFEKLIWRIEDVAKFLGCSVGHVYNLRDKNRKNRIPSFKKGKFVYFIPSQVHEWVLQGD